MIRFLGVLTLLLFGSYSFSQEVLEPIGAIARGKVVKHLKSATNNLDSTFVYTYDTISLPVLDEFSTSKIQSHIANPGDPNVTEQLYHELLDMGDLPLPANSMFSANATKRFTTSAGTTTEINLTPTPIKKGNLDFYPIQYSNVSAYPPYNIYDTTDVVGDLSDTIWLDYPDYFQDSARIFSAHLTGPNSIWIDSTAYRNFTHALNPWTLGVMTFDGLDENGYPYVFNSTASSYNDYLTSKWIDLSYVPNDSVYLTFLVQREGFGDEPEAGDSLVLEFYDSGADDWDRVWAINGGDVGDFKLGHIRITQAAFLTDAFRFRFKNYGSVAGMLDEFHLDYVHLRTGSGYQDTLLKDFAFVYPVGSLIETYTQVPWDHWVNDPTHMSSNVQVTVRNGSNLPENTSDGNVAISFGGVVEGNFTLQNAILTNGDLNYGPRTVYQSFHDFTGGYVFSTTPTAEQKTFDIKSTATAPFAHLALNDTCYTKQFFGNEYAYDDGSAEGAFGINGTQARIALRFDPYESDTLMGVKIHFVPQVNDLSDKLFMLTIWANNNGVPGAVLYEDNFLNPRSPVYEDGRGVFTEYYLPDSALLLPDAPFFVGYRQVDANKLNTGFDRNNDNSSKAFFSLNGGVTWTNSSIAGTVMMRPIFKTSGNYDLAVEDSEVFSDWLVYPNPTTAIVRLQFDNPSLYSGAIVRSISGQVVGHLSSTEMEFDMSSLPAGMYFIEALNNPKVVKVIRQ